MRKPGRFVVVEGLEGAGKSTIVNEMTAFLTHRQVPWIQTREPGGTAIGESLRALIKTGAAGETLCPKAELLLMYAARVQLLEQVIHPALANGTWVIADRFDLSSYAYQGGGRQLDKKMITQLSAFCVEDLQPDCLFFLDLPPEQGLKRAAARGAFDRIEQESLAFFDRVNAAYHERLAALPMAVVLDATQPVAASMAQITIRLDELIHES